MEFSVRILITIILTMTIMHGVTIFMVLYHKEKLCSHANQVKSWIRGNKGTDRAIANQPRLGIPSRPITDVNMHSKDFDDLFGIVTGIEAMDESYVLR